MTSALVQQLQLHGVDVRLGQSVTAVEDDGGKPVMVLDSNERIACDMGILSVGVRPEVSLATDAGLELGETGGIAVDQQMRTSDGSIYAVGDAVEVRHLVGGRPVLIPMATRR